MLFVTDSQPLLGWLRTGWVQTGPRMQGSLDLVKETRCTAKRSFVLQNGVLSNRMPIAFYAHAPRRRPAQHPVLDRAIDRPRA